MGRRLRRRSVAGLLEYGVDGLEVLRLLFGAEHFDGSKQLLSDGTNPVFFDLFLRFHFLADFLQLVDLEVGLEHRLRVEFFRNFIQ